MLKLMDRLLEYTEIKSEEDQCRFRKDRCFIEQFVNLKIKQRNIFIQKVITHTFRLTKKKDSNYFKVSLLISI